MLTTMLNCLLFFTCSLALAGGAGPPRPTVLRPVVELLDLSWRIVGALLSHRLTRRRRDALLAL